MDSIKRIDTSMSSVRPILPGLTYTLPPAPAEKLNLLEVSADAVIEKLRSEPRQIELSRRLQECLQGVSPLLCREIAGFAARGVEKTIFELTPEETDRLRFYLETLTDNMKQGRCTPMMLVDESGIKITYTGMEMTEEGNAELRMTVENNSEQPILVNVQDFSANGMMMNAMFANQVTPGKKSNDELTIYASTLEENGVTAVESVEFSLVVFNDDTLDTIVETDLIALTV